MKQRTKYYRVVALMAMLALAGILAGCAAAQTPAQTNQQAASEQSAQESQSAPSSEAAQAEQSSQSSQQDQSSQAAAANAPSSPTQRTQSAQPAQPSQQVVEASITEDQAKEIALKHAGLKEADTTFMFLHQDFDDGVLEWDVEFMSGNTEYDYSINAETGDIISFDNEVEYRGDIPVSGNEKQNAATQNNVNSNSTNSQAAGNSGSGDYIDPEAAKKAALDHAKIAEADCYELGVELEQEGNPVHYDVEFTSNGTEYNYIIDATTGEVMYFESEIDD